MIDSRAGTDARIRNEIGALVEIEQRVTGWLLYDAPGARSLSKVVQDWGPQCQPPHDLIIAAICANVSRGLEASPNAIALALADDGGFAKIGGREYLANMAQAAPVIIDAHQGREQIERAMVTHRRICTRRFVTQDARDIVASLESGDPDALERLAELGRSATQITTAASIIAKPYQWRDSSEIPPREWLYGRHAIRGFISATVAPGGVGKTALAIAEALALASGRNILNDAPLKRGRVWYIGLEDPEVEYERRVAAAALLHKIPPNEFAGGLFLNSGRAGEFIIGTDSRDGLQIFRPVVSAIIENVRRHDIALVIIDPYVGAHSVPESDNTLVAAIQREFACIADETKAAIELIHHVRKSGASGGDGAADDARGASAFVNATRSARQLIPMTADEASRGGVEDRRRFFRVVSAKANLAPFSEGGAWRELTSITLRNGGGGPDDHVGAVAAWEMPDAASMASPEEVDAICRRLADGKGRADMQASAWAGIAVADVLGLDVTQKEVKDNIRRAIKSWLADGTLKIVLGRDEKRRDREFVIPGDAR